MGKLRLRIDNEVLNWLRDPVRSTYTGPMGFGMGADFGVHQACKRAVELGMLTEENARRLIEELLALAARRSPKGRGKP